MEVNVPISLGELLDKISILEIKKQKIVDKTKNENISKELKSLKSKFNKLNISSNEVEKLYDELKKVNLKLWNIEDEIRILEKNKIFNKKFIDLARSVYITNDKRFEIKNSINSLLESSYVEEKSYEKY